MNLGALVSETRNPQTMDWMRSPRWSWFIVLINRDTLVAEAVKATLPQVALCG